MTPENARRVPSVRSPRRFVRCALLALLAAAQPASGQPPEAAKHEPGAGAVVGNVFDAETGVAIRNAAVTLTPIGWAPPIPVHTRTTDGGGDYRFDALPAGRYAVRLERSGYEPSDAGELVVKANETARGDFPMTALAAGSESDYAAPEEFLVVGTPMDFEALDLRIDAQEFLNVMDAGELGKFAAGDVADAIKRIAGVNVVEGQFAIIRGLEDRYSSTTYNGAPVPSPDPDRQSVQLDLFPSDVVERLVVAKTFGGAQPSNSSGGSIDIVTHEYPEEQLELKLSLGSGYNDNARDRFLDFVGGSPTGRDANEYWESDYGGSLGGRFELFDRELRFEALVQRETDFETKDGVQEAREPRAAQTRLFPTPPVTVVSGDLSLGELSLTNGRFDYTESERVDQTTYYGALGFDLDGEGNHRVDASVFYSLREQEVVQRRDDGFLPNFDYSTLAQKQANGIPIDANTDYQGFATVSSWIARGVRGDALDPPSRGQLWFANVDDARSFERERDLIVYQLNGDHAITQVDGLHASWAVNHAKTNQDETFTGVRYFFEPADKVQSPAEFPTTSESLGAGSFAASEGVFFNDNEIVEEQDFARFDVDYERDLFDWLRARVDAGFWWESADRRVDTGFLLTPTVAGSTQFAITADSPESLGVALFPSLDPGAGGQPSGVVGGASDGTRDIEAWHVGTSLTGFENYDLFGGVRFEKIEIESNNDPFTGELAFDGSPKIFPTKYLFFDRLDNPARNEVSAPPPPGTTFNDQLVGIHVPVDPVTGFVDLVDRAAIEQFVNGRIDEERTLPYAGLTLRPFEGLTLRGAWSETVARPSLREMGYYVSVEPATDDLIVGNPQLQLSDVESYDARIEYVFGNSGDLFAIGVFQKQIEKPIESIVIRDPTNFEGSSSSLYRTFFNNENEADLEGYEVELRKHFDFVGDVLEWFGVERGPVEVLDYLSVGGNYTEIDAEVDRSEIELARAAPFFGVAAGDVARYDGLEKSRRLFGQPEWIANADLTFDHPDWGTRATLAFFAISDVLDAAGSATIAPSGQIIAYTLDRYVDSYYQLDLVLSQTLSFDFVPGSFTLEASAKNLTDTTRRIIYDREQTRQRYSERAWQVGLDYSFSVSYELAF
jgi:TonB-dependent receptor